MELGFDFNCDPELNSVLRKDAIGYGLCNEWQKKWIVDKELSELVEMFKKGQDFCIKHDFPSVEFIRSRFDIPSLSQFGIFVDEIPLNDNETLSNGTYVCMGECRGILRFGRWAAADIYLRHDSNVRIEADEFARIHVSVYDNAEVDTQGCETARIRIYDRR